MQDRKFDEVYNEDDKVNPPPVWPDGWRVSDLENRFNSTHYVTRIGLGIYAVAPGFNEGMTDIYRRVQEGTMEYWQCVKLDREGSIDKVYDCLMNVLMEEAL